jgi:colanic acid/amylovoran biosynthesis glycosyltransferase
MTDAALIFRLQMFKPSEPFITAQGGALREFAPVYLGRNRFGAAPDAANHALEDLPAWQMPQILWNAATRRPGAFIKLLERRPARLVHAHFGPDAVYALKLARALSVPLVTTFHGFDATVSAAAMLRSRSPYLANYVMHRKQLARGGAMFLAVSRHIHAKLLALEFPPANTRLHYIGVDTRAITPPLVRAATPRILHVARLVEKKGTSYLIQAFAHIAAHHPRLELVIIGDGPLRGVLEAQAAASGFGARIKFLGSQPNQVVLRHMQEAALFALPSVTSASGDTEGLPISILEAAASGLAVIATTHGGIPEAVQDGVTGILVPVRDDEALAAALETLASDEAARLRMGQAARTLIERDFNLASQTSILEQIYRDVIS